MLLVKLKALVADIPMGVHHAATLMFIPVGSLRILVVASPALDLRQVNINELFCEERSRQ